MVTLMTLYTAKGLGFPLVFLISPDKNIFPRQGSVGGDREVEEEWRLG